jgi:hypothetical protein
MNCAMVASACACAGLLGCASTRVPAGLTEQRRACELPVPSSRSWHQTLAAARDASERWLRTVEYEVETVYGEGSEVRPHRLERPAGAPTLALLSYASVGAGHHLHGRSFVYDNALGVLWFTATGDEARARGLARTLVTLQNPDGTWGFSFSTQDGFYNAQYVRMGTVAWAAHALATFDRRFHDPPSAQAAQRAAHALLASRRGAGDVAPGLVEGGRGLWAPDGTQFDPGFRLRTAITEHQLDAQMALSTLAPQEAGRLRETIMASLWIAEEGRFGNAVAERGRDDSRVLDAAGAWGALWLLAGGDRERARHSFAYTVRTFATRDGRLRGFRPYLDPIEGSRSATLHELIFVEGTLALGLAAHRLGEPDIAGVALQVAVDLSCRLGPGIPYANREALDFPAEPAAASTIWFLFLERELRTGLAAPLFPSPAGAS